MPTLWRSTAPDWTTGEAVKTLQLFQLAYPVIDDLRRAAVAAGVDLGPAGPGGDRWDHGAILQVVAARARLLPLAAELLHDQSRSLFHEPLRQVLGAELSAAHVELLDTFGTPQDPVVAKQMLTPETVERWRRQGDLEALNAPGAPDDSADARARAVDNARNRTALIRRGLDNPLGTGVLIGPDLLLTAGHVVTRRGQPWPPTDAGSLTAVFDYRDATQTPAERGTPVAVAGLVDGQPPEDHEWQGGLQGPVRDDRLDFAVLRLARPVGLEVGLGGGPRGWFLLDPVPYDYTKPTHFDLWGHPRGRVLASTFTVDAIVPVGEARIRYTTNTDKGSSGSPVVDHRGQLVAIHHFARDGQLVNQGVPIARIYAALIGRAELNQTVPTALPGAAGTAGWPGLATGPAVAAPIVLGEPDPFATIEVGGRPVIDRLPLRPGLWELAEGQGRRTLVITGPEDSGVSTSYEIIDHAAARARIHPRLQGLAPDGIKGYKLDLRPYVTTALATRRQQIITEIYRWVEGNDPSEIKVAQVAREILNFRTWARNAFATPTIQWWLFVDSMDEIAEIKQHDIDEVLGVLLGLAEETQLNLRVVLAGRQPTEFEHPAVSWAVPDTASGISRYDTKVWFEARAGARGIALASDQLDAELDLLFPPGGPADPNLLRRAIAAAARRLLP